MTEPRPGTLGEIAVEAGQERAAFLNDAASQLRRFLEANRQRIADVGGMVLLDEDPDYLSVAPDLTFRSRTRVQDAATGDWSSETEVIESPSEIVELYNPSDLYAWFAEAAREQGGLPDQPTAAGDLLDEAGISEEEAVGVGIGGSDPYIGAADDWAAGQEEAPPADAAEAARRLYDLALTFQSRSQVSEARLVEQFEIAAAPLSGALGDLLILDDEDERVWFKSQGSFEAEVIPEPEDGEEAAEGGWKPLESPEDLVQYYDPTDLFGNLAETLAEQFPTVDPEFHAGEGEDEA
jgi:hypothetical protein